MASINETDRAEIAAFVAALKSYGPDLTKKELSARVKGRAQRLVNRLAKDYAPATVHGVLTFYRNEVRASGLPGADDPKGVWLRYLRLPKFYADERNATTREAVAGRRVGQIDVSARRFTADAKAALSAQDWREKAVAVAALTGRRLAEVLIYGDFTPAPGKSPALMFDGQAKTRGAAGTMQEAYQIPTLADGAEILRALSAIHAERPELRGMDYNTFHDTHASKLTMATRRVFSGAFSEVPKSKDLRAAYAAINYAKFLKTNKGKGKSVIEFYASILGHKLFASGGAADLTAASYDYVRVTK